MRLRFIVVLLLLPSQSFAQSTGNNYWADLSADQERWFGKYLEGFQASVAMLPLDSKAKSAVAATKFQFRNSHSPDGLGVCVNAAELAYVQPGPAGSVVSICTDNFIYVMTLVSLAAQFQFANQANVSLGDFEGLIEQYGAFIRRQSVANRANYTPTGLPCTITEFVYSDFAKSDRKICAQPTFQLGVSARALFSDRKYIPQLYDLQKAVQFQKMVGSKDDPITWVTAQVSDVYGGAYNALVQFILCHELGHVINGDLESNSPETERSADQTGAKIYSFWGSDTVARNQYAASIFIMHIAASEFAAHGEAGRADFAGRADVSMARLVSIARSLRLAAPEQAAAMDTLRREAAGRFNLPTNTSWDRIEEMVQKKFPKN